MGHSNKLQTAGASYSTFFAALFGLCICLHAPASSHAESVPETIARHEAEIKKLNEAIRLLQKNQNSDVRESQGASSRIQIQPPPAECIKNFSVIGKQRLFSKALDGSAKLAGTDVILKLLRVGKETDRFYVQLASNIPELHHKKWFRGEERRFKNGGCNFTIEFEGLVYSGSSLELSSLLYLDIFLNYQE